jgi:hypothetical protein
VKIPATSSITKNQGLEMRPSVVINYSETPAPVLIAAKQVVQELEKRGVDSRDIATELKTVQTQINVIKHVDKNMNLKDFVGEYKYHKLPKIIRHLSLEFYMTLRELGYTTENGANICGINAANALNWHRLYKQLKQKNEMLSLKEWADSVVDHYNSIKNLTI